MKYKIKRWVRPVNLLLILGFSFSFSAVIIGISSILQIIKYAARTGKELPLGETFQNSGTSMMILVWLFSVINCFAVVNYRMISEKKTFLVKKAFGAADSFLLKELAVQMSIHLFVSLLFAGMIILFLTKRYAEYFSVQISPALITYTMIILIVTFLSAMLIPFFRIMQMAPVEVVK